MFTKSYMVSHKIRIELHPEVYEEIVFSMQWYEERALNLGYEFLEQINFSIQRISEEPEVWSFYDSKKKLRKFLIHRFPYAIIFIYEFPILKIIAVANLKRKPGYWKFRIQ